jgi:ABC-type Zn uptake system ZnuABC Zn-binding protein ZnuA
MKILSMLILCLIGPVAHATGTLFCSHRELCQLINQIALENNVKPPKTESLVNISGDPHEYEPSSEEIKNLISAPFLITGPNELNPWIKKVNFQRSKNTALKTVSLLFEQSYLSLYPKASPEALSHFWLYPKIYCALKQKTGMELKSADPNLHLESKSCDYKKPEGQLQAALVKTKLPIILTHDALLPLLQALDSKHEIVAIKGSGHHEEVSSQSVKRMVDALDTPVVIWIIETGINVPSNVLQKIRKNDIVIKLDTASSKVGNPFSALDELTVALNKQNKLAGKKE